MQVIMMVLFYLREKIRNNNVLVESCSVVIVCNACIGPTCRWLGRNCSLWCGLESRVHMLQFYILLVKPFSIQICHGIDLMDQHTGMRYKKYLA